MKKLLLSAMLLAGLVIVGCQKEELEVTNLEPTTETPSWEKDTVTIAFSPYTQTPMESRTRAVTSIAGIVTHLDVWITTGTTTIDFHQTSTDADFGTITAVLDKTKTYTINAVAHKCDGDATLSDGVISFPDDKVTHAMLYSNTFLEGSKDFRLVSSNETRQSMQSCLSPYLLDRLGVNVKLKFTF